MMNMMIKTTRIIIKKLEGYNNKFLFIIIIRWTDNLLEKMLQWFQLYYLWLFSIRFNTSSLHSYTIAMEVFANLELALETRQFCLFGYYPSF